MTNNQIELLAEIQVVNMKLKEVSKKVAYDEIDKLVYDRYLLQKQFYMGKWNASYSMGTTSNIDRSCLSSTWL